MVRTGGVFSFATNDLFVPEIVDQYEWLLQQLPRLDAKLLSLELYFLRVYVVPNEVSLTVMFNPLLGQIHTVSELLLHATVLGKTPV